MKNYEQALQKCKAEGTYRTLTTTKSSGKFVQVEGQRLLNLSGNDYLGLLDAPELLDEFLQTTHNDPLSSASSRLLSGNDEAYELFERELAETYGKPSALIWDSGYHANSGILPVLALPRTLILADRLVHASIIDGIRLSGSPFKRFRHNDVSHLSQILEQNCADYDQIWVVTESLFSMDGDFAPLEEIVQLKRKYPQQVYIYLDEAHAVGVRGDEGLGYASELNLLDDIDILVGTLGKALGSVGAYSLQSNVLRQLFISKARPLIFSTALPPMNISWSHFIFNKQRRMNERRVHLRALIKLFSERMGHTYASQILPIIIPGEEAVTNAAAELTRQGYYVRPIRKPTVPEGYERIRLSLTSALSIDEVEQLANVLKK